MGQQEKLNALLEASVENGFDSNINLEYSSVQQDEVRAEITIDSTLLQPAGIVHGGVLCSIVESVASAGATAWVLENSHECAFVGIANTTDFFRSVRDGGLTAIGRPLHQGRRTQVWSVEVFDKDILVARGTLRGQNISRG